MMKTRFFFLISLLIVLMPLSLCAQKLMFSQPHGFCEAPFSLTISATDELPEGTVIRYTVDGSEPTFGSQTYTQALDIKTTTILRAAAFSATARLTPVATATWIFAADVLKQSDHPAGYPDEWGYYTQIGGIAKADYGMDPEMTNDKKLAPKIIEGLKSLPVLSIVTDKDNLFSHENDEERGGIYIFTGPPVGDATGHGWTRPASVELMGGPQQHDLTVDCGLRLHGGHGRLAEKNPKHSFRLVFKAQYGPKSLEYPVFGADDPQKFNQLVVRCHFGNTWQHWAEGNREKAQYTRDVWARRMQRKMGHTSVNALYVNLFLNGMYWGLYNIAERVDDQFGKDHLGGAKSDIDVVKIEEDGGNHIEASEGTLDAWEEMVENPESLLDIDAFIDYMLINQYAGNTDWDHHNWYAINRRGADSPGFRFLCWDSEIIFENVYENVLGKNNGKAFPTGIFHNLLKNDDFARRYVHRAKELLSDDGFLGQQSVVEVWDSLYNTISKAIYAEAARWGDYRRDVHQWQSKGKLYTVDDTYKKERNRLLNDYFPYRTDIVLSDILSFVNIDDFVAPESWVKLTASMFHEWNGTGASAKPLDTPVNVEWNMGVNAGGGTAVAGFGNVEYNRYADLSAYDELVLRGTGDRLRILANRLVDHGPRKEIIVSFNESDPYWDAALQCIVVPLADLKNMADTDGKNRKENFLHLNVLKVDWNNTVNLRAAYLVPKGETDIRGAVVTPDADVYYNLQGQKVMHPTKGVYIKNGKKVIVR